MPKEARGEKRLADLDRQDHHAAPSETSLAQSASSSSTSCPSSTTLGSKRT
jgi:hypothetical protein